MASVLPTDERSSEPTAKAPETHVIFSKRPIFSHLVTVRPDGSPQSSVMWFDWDGTMIRFTHTKIRQKVPECRRRATNSRVSMHDPDDPYRSLEVRGVVETIVDDASGEFDRGLAVRYDISTALDDAHVRVVITIRPTRFVTYGSPRTGTS